MNRLTVYIGLCAAVCLGACAAEKTEQQKLAGYVSKESNGLAQKKQGGAADVTCQYIPEKTAETTASKFVVYIDTKTAAVDDSLMYLFNYQSAGLFRLVSAGDTLKPVLSERIANGKRDLHQFTVVFDNGKPVSPGGISLIVNSNPVFKNDLVFDYKYDDITKAQKKLYDYDAVKH